MQSKPIGAIDFQRALLHGPVPGAAGLGNGDRRARAVIGLIPKRHDRVEPVVSSAKLHHHQHVIFGHARHAREHRADRQHGACRALNEQRRRRRQRHKPDAALRPSWTPLLHHLLESRIDEIVIADPAWLSLVAAVAASGWLTQDLLSAAAEHLRDIADTERLRADEYARLLAAKYAAAQRYADTTADPDSARKHLENGRCTLPLAA